MKYRPKISIILPVHNVEPYLKECLESLISQTLKEIEIICIENGSTDKSPSLLKDFSKQDSRIQIITLEEADLGKARNTGTRAASGEYLMFIDSDDYIQKDSCEKLYSIAEDNKLEVLQGLFYTRPHRLFPMMKTKRKNLNQVMTGLEFWQKNTAFSQIVWDKLWKKDFYTQNDLFCLEGIFSEDCFTSMRMMAKVKRFMVTDFRFYIYRKVDSSISNRPVSPQHVRSHFVLTQEIKKFIEKTGLTQNPLLIEFYYKVLFLYFIHYRKEKRLFMEEKKNIDKMIAHKFSYKSRLSFYMPRLAILVYPLWRKIVNFYLPAYFSP